MERVLAIIGILAIPIVWGLASARLIEWLHEKRHNPTGQGREG